MLAEPVALCRLSPSEPVPAWTAEAREFLTVSRTPTELSIVADESVVPPAADAQRGYRVLRVEGPLPLELVGVFAAMAGPLAAMNVPIFPIATYDTDYLLVHDAMLERAIAALTSAGHVVRYAATDAPSGAERDEVASGSRTGASHQDSPA
ncbi:MAG TPA: ACT domain-containing protein [Gemmatimonadaceae bacterium]